MEDMIRNANLYSAYLTGSTTREENCKIMKRMLKSPILILELNLAAVNISNTKE